MQDVKINRDVYHLIMGYLGIFYLTTMFIIFPVHAEQQSLGQIPYNSNNVLIPFQCENCTYVNVSSIYYIPTAINTTIERAFTKRSGNYYELLWTKSVAPINIGKYYFYGHGNPNGVDTPFTFDLEIIKSRTPYNLLFVDVSENAILMVLAFLFIIAIGLLAFKSYLYSGAMFFLIGGLVLYNNISLILGFVFIGMGVMLIFNGE